MQHRSRIFISAVSKELHSSRQLVANTLQFMGYEPDWQDTFETQEGDLRWMLRRRIDECQGVMQLVGQCYGAESKTIEDEEFGRVSYTQYEALYAKKQGKQLWIFVLDEDYPVDEHEAESEELAQLQQAYRKQVSSTGDLYYRMTNPDAIEAGTLKLRNELAALRRGFRRWAIGVSAVLALVFAITVWVFLRQGETNKAIGETAEASKRIADETKVTSRVSQETAVIAKHTAEVTENTAEIAERTGKSVDETRETVREMDSRETIEAASARLKLATDAMNLANHGQVEALMLLLANKRTFVSSKFDGVALAGADLSGGAFSSSSFYDAELTDAKFIDADLDDATLLFAVAPGLNASRANGKEMRIQMAVIDRGNFDEADLTQASFYWSRLPEASFRGTNCTAVNFSYTDLSKADFTGANLTDAQFIGSIIDGANFEGAIFKNTDMSGAKAKELKVTAEQRSEFCRIAGLNGYQGMSIGSKFESSRYSTGWEFNDEFRLGFRGVAWPVPSSLRLRKGGLEPAGFTASWLRKKGGDWEPGESNLRFFIERNFLVVGNRYQRIQDRIQEHGDFLVKATENLPSVEGDGREFADWWKQLRENAEHHAPVEPLTLNHENIEILRLSQGQDTPEWYKLDANHRHRYEWGDAADEDQKKDDSSVYGWHRLYPASSFGFDSLPSEHEEVYNEWTAKRIKAAANADIVFDFEIRLPSRRPDPDRSEELELPFHRFVANQSKGSMATTFPKGATKLFPECRDEPTAMSIRRKVFLEFPLHYSAYRIKISEAMTFPVQAEVIARFKSYDVREAFGSKKLYDVIIAEPASITLTDDKGKTWSGGFEIR